MPTIKDIAPESVFTIELNAGTPGRQGPKGEQGIQGIQGPKGEPGPKPIRGIDYFTQQDISNMVTTVTGNSNSAFNENVSAKTKEFNANVSAKTSAFDNNAMLKTEEFNANANSKKTDFNLNANNRTTEFNTNASNKKNEIDTYVTNKTTEFDKHVENKVNEFKEETSEYVTENELESKGYLVESDLNDYAKEKDLFSGSYNDLKDKPKIPSKTSELTNDKGFINAIPSEYVTEEEQEEFIKPYNERITENEKYISDLEATIDILTNTDKKRGELVHITDALPLATFENKVDGNVKQETTKGYQLLPNTKLTSTSRGVTLTYDNGTLTATGTATETGYANFNLPFILPKGVIHSQSSGDFSYRLLDSSYNVICGNETQHNNKTLETEVNVSHFALIVNQGQTYNGTQKIMVSVGTSDLEWEQNTNGASPNPEYPQEIEVIEGDLSFKVNGKNLLSVDMFIDNTIPSINTGQNVSGDGNTATSYIEIDNSLPLIYSTSQTGKGKYAFYYDENYNYLGYKANSAEAYLEISKADYYKNAKYIRLRLDGLTKETIEKAQLEYNEVATDYEPYQEQIVPLDLKGNWVGAINDNIKDYLVTDKKRLYLVKNVGKVVLDGSESWMLNGGTTDYGQYMNTSSTPDKAYGKINIISDKFISKYSNDSNSIAGRDVNSYIFLTIAKSIVSFDLNVFKTWLSNNNVTVYYQLAEPQIIELGELPEPIKTFEGVNNIQLLANLDTEIEVKYALDVKKYYDNKLAEISAQII